MGRRGALRRGGDDRRLDADRDRGQVGPLPRAWLSCGRRPCRLLRRARARDVGPWRAQRRTAAARESIALVARCLDPPATAIRRGGGLACRGALSGWVSAEARGREHEHGDRLRLPLFPFSAHRTQDEAGSSPPDLGRRPDRGRCPRLRRSRDGQVDRSACARGPAPAGCASSRAAVLSLSTRALSGRLVSALLGRAKRASRRSSPCPSSTSRSARPRTGSSEPRPEAALTHGERSSRLAPSPARTADSLHRRGQSSPTTRRSSSPTSRAWRERRRARG